jgi:hypothetical protein
MDAGPKKIATATLARCGKIDIDTSAATVIVLHRTVIFW